MKINKLFALVPLYFLIFPVLAFSQKLKPEEILVKHLDSVGKPENRSKIESQIAVGEANVRFISQKNPAISGRVVLASEANKFFWGLNLDAANYPAEKFVFDGKKVKAGFVRAGQRSILGNFILSNEAILEEGLLGSVLSTNWALFKMADRKSKLSFEGNKKIDGKEVYVIGYTPKNGSLEIQLFFDKETFRHLRTEYKQTFSAAIGRTGDESPRNSASRLKVVENFSDFKQENSLTLPHSYSLLYTITGQNGTTEIEWKFNLTEFAFNQKLAADAFNIEGN